jgi:hypothetical protein
MALGLTKTFATVLLMIQAHNVPDITQDDLLNVISTGELTMVKIVDPTPIDVSAAWDYIVKREYGNTKSISNSSPQWLEWLYRDKLPQWVHDKTSYNSGDASFGKMQDLLAIAPLNITPQFLVDISTRNKLKFLLCEMAAKTAGYEGTAAVSYSTLVVSGVPSYIGEMDNAWKYLWNTRVVSHVSNTRRVVFLVAYRDQNNHEKRALFRMK